jgi:uncharacterized protein YegP (UPF0339 family)
MFRRSILAFGFTLLPVLAIMASAVTLADTMTFEIYADAKGEYRWRLLDKDGKNVANSGQGYGKKADCKAMVSNFKDDISKYAFETYKDNSMQTRFRLKAKNGNVVGASTSGFEKEDDAKKVIEAIQKGTKTAEIKEIEGKDDGKKK